MDTAEIRFFVTEPEQKAVAIAASIPFPV